MNLIFFNAACGDAAQISYRGLSGTQRHIFIDSGLERTYRDILHELISGIFRANENIDLWIISHIHDDHIGGVMNYIGAIQAKRAVDIVKCWWYNPPRKSDTLFRKYNPSIAISIRQGDILTEYLSNTEKLPKNTIQQSTTPFELDGMKLWVLSPDANKLNRLNKKYADPNTPLERNEKTNTSISVSRKQRDYNRLTSDFPPVDSPEDNNLVNGSSIALISEYNDKKVLWLADAHPSIVVEGLEKLGYNDRNKLICDYVKVAHHGSSGNVSTRLYSMLKSSNYVISSDGYNNHGLPTKEAILKILQNPARDMAIKYRIIFTNDDSILRSIFDVDGPKILEQLNFELVFPDNPHKLLVNL